MSRGVAGSAGGRGYPAGGNQINLDMVAIESAEAAGAEQGHQIWVRKLPAHDEFAVSERTDFDRELEKIGNGRRLLVAKRAGDRELYCGVVRRQ